LTGVASAALAGAWLATRRLWLPIGMHFAWGIAAVVLMRVAQRRGHWLP